MLDCINQLAEQYHKPREAIFVLYHFVYGDQPIYHGFFRLESSRLAKQRQQIQRKIIMPNPTLSFINYKSYINRSCNRLSYFVESYNNPTNVCELTLKLQILDS